MMAGMCWYFHWTPDVYWNMDLRDRAAFVRLRDKHIQHEKKPG